MLRRTALLGLLLAVALAPALARADSYGAEVGAVDNSFSPQIVRIQPGQSVEWANDGRSPHTVTADDGSWNSGNLAAGGTFEHTFSQAGVFTYYCKYHGSPGVGMIGTIVVGDAPLPGPTGTVGPGREPVPGKFGPTVHVPADYPTIQAGVDHAAPGGMVLVSPGVYKESVVVTTPFITIRGLDRNRTILDGGFHLANGIAVMEADGVTLQNLTTRHYLLNGFYWDHVYGFWGQYLTATDNGDYGIFAYASQYGQFDHSYASGSPDSGFYIGQCYPCHALITDVISERNAAGFSGTNAGGDFAIVNSEWAHNMSGITPNTLDSEANPPQHDVLIAGNYVHDNNNLSAPTKALTYPSYGIGIMVAGGNDNLVTQNLVEDSGSYGIAVTPIIDTNFWSAGGNRVTDNIVRRSGLADLALSAPAGKGNCFAGNDSGTSVPPAIEMLYPCSGLRPFSGGGSMAPFVEGIARLFDAMDGTFPHGDWRTQPPPPPQPSMADPAHVPPEPAVPGITVPQRYRIRDPAAIQLAAGPTVSQEVTVLGSPLATSWGALLLGLYGYILPFVLYAAWVSISLWDLIRQEGEAISHRARWMAVVLLVPFLGPILYFAFGRSPIPKQLRVMLVAGGIGAYLFFAVLAALVGG
jgi:plastocyanin